MASIMPNDMRAYCGLDCKACPAYIALQTKDDELRARTARRWSSPGFVVEPKEVDCEGCRSAGGTMFKHCSVCNVRACGIKRGLVNCAYCKEYPCDKLQTLYKTLGDEQPRMALERIRMTLKAL
ncbi:MAG: hypothetical protein C4K49_00220 [Candidatus Thorarchaeota archaeon]|nr:MAG: hypothetical protein C4K49_00220 [Candidatus Thorarchaeota archaeon]